MKKTEYQQLKPQTVKKIKAWLEAKWPEKNHTCEVCQNTHWQIASHIVAPMTMYNGQVQFGSGPVYPLLPVTCTSCGNTKFFNSALMDIQEGEEKEVLEENKEKENA